MSAISQLQVTYDPGEDRLLLRVNTTASEEFRFWLTRRYTLLLNDALKKHRENDPDVSVQPTTDAKQAIQEFKREEAQTKGEFNTKFNQSESFPLGEKPMLAHRLKYGLEGQKLQLSIEPKEGTGITLGIDPSLNFNITKLLSDASAKGQWSLDFGDLNFTAPANRVIN